MITLIRKYLLSFIVLLTILPVSAQQKGVWNGKPCAIALTYDDALHIHLDQVVPALDSFKLKGTFYLSGFSSGFRERLEDWKKAATKGHELANHTLFHPCTGGPGREWVRPERDLSKYTVQQMTEEMLMTNTVLQALDGKTQRTFAYPCGDTKIGEVSYFDKVKDNFVAARSTKNEFLSMDQIDLSNVGCVAINGQSGDELIALAKKAMETHTLLVFLFHGVGGEHNINVSLEAHRKLLQFLQKNQSQIWIAPFLDIAQYVKAYQQGTKNGKSDKSASPK